MNATRRTLGLAALLCSLIGGAWAQTAPIKVGVILPLSGGAGPQGQHVTQAIQTMALLINESGGVLGRSLEIVVRDDESTPAVGVSRANDLLGQGVSVILEGWNSPVALAMQPVIARAGVLDIVALGTVCVVDLEARRVQRDGADVRLTPTEYRLLARLVQQAGQVVTHRQLLLDVWGAEFTEHPHYLRLYMGQLRAKLEADPAQPRRLLTETGVGYRLVEPDQGSGD